MLKFLLIVISLFVAIPAYSNEEDDKAKISLFGSNDSEKNEDSSEKQETKPADKNKKETPAAAEEVEEIPTKLAFIDEGKDNESFAEFRATLLKKIEQKDAAYIRSILDPTMKFNFGGPNDFISFYGLEGPNAKNSVFWKDLKNVMVLGGSFQDGEFCAPYVFCNWPDAIRDSAMAAIIGENVELKKAPSKNAATVETLNYDIVKTLFSSAALKAGWVQVQTKSGSKGFVPKDAIRSPTEYRALFKQKGDKWVLTAFLSGGLVY